MVSKKWFKNFGLKNQIQINSSTPIKNPNPIFQIYINCYATYIKTLILILKRFNEVKWTNLYIYTKIIFELKFAMLKSILTILYYITYTTKKEWNLFLDPILQQI